MEHFYQKIDGWFRAERTYREALDQLPAYGVAVEIGCYKGRGAAFLGVEAVRLNRHIRIYTVDTFDCTYSEVRRDIYPEAMTNLLPVLNVVKVLPVSSLQASRLFTNGRVDLVIIDNAFARPYVDYEITAWLPKVKPGGLLMGTATTNFGIMDAVKTLPGPVRCSENCWLFSVPQPGGGVPAPPG